MKQFDFFKTPMEPTQIHTRKPMHVVLKSQSAVGPLSFLSDKNVVEDIVRGEAIKHGVAIDGFENVGNHLHMLLRSANRFAFAAFLQNVRGKIENKLRGSNLGKPLTEHFWDEPYIRAIHSYQDLRALKNYFAKNEAERELGPAARRTIEAAEHERKRLVRNARARLARASKRPTADATRTQGSVRGDLEIEPDAEAALEEGDRAGDDGDARRELAEDANGRVRRAPLEAERNADADRDAR